MQCPSLNELPPPPAHKTGWPWTEESQRLSAGRPAPRVTIVTPSFNQGQYIEETIRSILLQGYPDLEYFVIDGGSTDDTVAVIKKYAPWITYWVSERDNGQSGAINRGLRRGTGVFATWINSDDMLAKDALRKHFESGRTAPAVYIGDCIHVGNHGNVLYTHRGQVRSFEDHVRVRSVWRSGGSIDQPAVLFPLELVLRLGGLNEANHLTMDYELWGQFLLAGVEFEYTGIPFGVFRWTNGQKSQDSVPQNTSMLDAAEALVRQSVLTREVREDILSDLAAYRVEYPTKVWKSSGRLASLGLPSSIVTPIRKFRLRLKEHSAALSRLGRTARQD